MPIEETAAVPGEAELTAAVMAKFAEVGERIRRDMGGARKIAKIHAEARLTVREHIDLLVDPGSFVELGTFVTEPKDGEDFWQRPGDGTIGGLATVAGRPVSVCADDDTVRRGTTGPRGQRKHRKLYELAVRRGTPFIILGQCSGSRLPEFLQPGHFAESAGDGGGWRLETRGRSIPVVEVIVGDSFGSSSFSSALSDFVVQLDGTCLSLTSPRVVETATGEVVSLEELGGTKVHARTTGQIDRSAATPAEAYDMVRSFLSFLPSRAGGPLPVAACEPVPDDPRIASLVPARRTRAYDVRTVIRRLADDATILEMKPAFSPNLVTALMRIGGVPAGVIANQPQQLAGSLTPDACLKAVRLMCMCDSFGLPVIFLADNPGFLVGTGAEYGRALARSQQLMQAHALLRVPACTVWLRKGFGLGFSVMGGGQPGVELSLAWPGAEIGFMDPDVAVNVLYAGRAAELPEADRPAFLAEQATNLATDFAPYGVASSMTVDEIIEPAATRRILADYLRSRILTAGGHAPACPACQRADTGPGPLAHWPFW